MNLELTLTCRYKLWRQLERADARLRRRVTSAIEPDSEVGTPEVQDDDPEYGCDDDAASIEHMCDVLERKRLGLGLDSQADIPFQVRLLGGEWLYGVTGPWRGAVHGYDKESSPAHVWCTKVSINHIARCNVSVYGEAGAHRLARA